MCWHLTAEQVVNMLDSDLSDEEDYDIDEVVFPGSNDELGFNPTEEELEDQTEQDELR